MTARAGRLRAVSTIAFIAAFVVLGLGTLLFAMSGGRGGVGSVLHSQSRGSRRFATFAFFVSLLVLGFAIPAAVIRAEENNTDIPHAGVTNLTPEEERGQELFGRRCGLCHSLKAANAVARVGPDLDALAPNEQFTPRRDQEGPLERQCPNAREHLHGARTRWTWRNLSQNPWALPPPPSRPAVDVKSTSVQVLRPLVRSLSGSRLS